MAKQIIPFLLLSLALLTGCKKDEWFDWKARNQMVLEQVKNEPGFTTTATGLVYRVLQDDFPSEAVPNSQSFVLCDPCLGYLVNGFQFQSAPTNAQVAQLIPGFQEGIKKFNTYIRKFPNSIIANMRAFEKKPYFEAEEGSEKAPKVEF